MLLWRFASSASSKICAAKTVFKGFPNGRRLCNQASSTDSEHAHLPYGMPRGQCFIMEASKRRRTLETDPLHIRVNGKVFGGIHAWRGA